MEEPFRWFSYVVCRRLIWEGRNSSTTSFSSVKSGKLADDRFSPFLLFFDGLMTRHIISIIITVEVMMSDVRREEEEEEWVKQTHTHIFVWKENAANWGPTFKNLSAMGVIIWLWFVSLLQNLGHIPVFPRWIRRTCQLVGDEVLTRPCEEVRKWKGDFPSTHPPTHSEESKKGNFERRRVRSPIHVKVYKHNDGTFRRTL